MYPLIIKKIYWLRMYVQIRWCSWWFYGSAVVLDLWPIIINMILDIRANAIKHRCSPPPLVSTHIKHSYEIIILMWLKSYICYLVKHGHLAVSIRYCKIILIRWTFALLFSLVLFLISFFFLTSLRVIYCLNFVVPFRTDRRLLSIIMSTIQISKELSNSR